MYRKGDGVEQDFEEATKWYYKASEEGHANAQNNLGAMIAKGMGALEDFVTAYAWFNISALQGNVEAKTNRDSVTKKMSRDQIAKAQELSKEIIENNPRLVVANSRAI